MKSEVSVNDLLKFEKKYHDDSANLIIENKIRQSGLLKACRTGSRCRPKFNLELPKSKSRHTGGSQSESFLRVVRDILCQSNLINSANFDLSTTFFNFYDKFEKANALYNELIAMDELSTDTIRSRVEWYIQDFSTFHLGREIVNKYGMAPLSSSKEAKLVDNQLAIILLQDKIKADAFSLLKMSSKLEKLSIKTKLMYEVYQLLAKIYGTPPTTFEFQDETFTPLEFKQHFLGDILEDYVTVTPFDRETLLDSYNLMPNLFLHDNETILHSTAIKIKEAIVKQLISGVRIWFSAEESVSTRYGEQILDSEPYAFDKLLNIPTLPITQKLSLGLADFDHAMCIVGALTKNNIPEQFKVETYDQQDKTSSPILMTKTFLETKVITLTLNKKFLV